MLAKLARRTCVAGEERTTRRRWARRSACGVLNIGLDNGSRCMSCCMYTRFPSRDAPPASALLGCQTRCFQHTVKREKNVVKTEVVRGGFRALGKGKGGRRLLHLLPHFLQQEVKQAPPLFLFPRPLCLHSLHLLLHHVLLPLCLVLMWLVWQPIRAASGGASGMGKRSMHHMKPPPCSAARPGRFFPRVIGDVKRAPTSAFVCI